MLDHAGVRAGLEALQPHDVGETVLCVQELRRDPAPRARLPRERVRVDHDVTALAPGELAQLHEQRATGLRERRVAEALGVEQERAGGPVAVLVAEHAVEHEDLLALGMVVRVEGRVGLVAHDRCDLTGLGRADEVHALAPDRAARARGPGHARGVGARERRQIAVDGIAHGSRPFFFSRDDRFDARDTA
jgi:hypothetical protein